MPPNLRARARLRTPEDRKCGLSVGNKCDWNPKRGAENQEVMWQVWDVWVLFGFGGGYTLKRMYVRSSKLSLSGWKALVAWNVPMFSGSSARWRLRRRSLSASVGQRKG